MTIKRHRRDNTEFIQALRIYALYVHVGSTLVDSFQVENKLFVGFHQVRADF